MRRVVVQLALVILLIPVTAKAGPINLLVNGSFELGPPFSNHDIDIPSGSTAITGWTVFGTSNAGGAIDYLGPPWDVADGFYAVDLDGRDSIGGGIEQAFATIVGETYLVSFDLSGNPGDSATNGLPLVKQVQVTAGNVVQDYSFDSSGQSITNLIWQPTAFSFVASGTTTTLAFMSLTPFPNSYGALIDNVTVTAVPEPASLLLLGTGLLGVVGTIRRRAQIIRSRMPASTCVQ